MIKRLEMTSEASIRMPDRPLAEINFNRTVSAAVDDVIGRVG
jgi:hypothetical protein